MSGSKVLIMLGFLLGVPAFAQFEVAPDHFDVDIQKPPLNQAQAKPKIQPLRQAKKSAVVTTQKRTRGKSTAITAPPTGAALQPVAVSTKTTTNSGTSTGSKKTHVQRRKTVASLQPPRNSAAEAAPK